MEIDIALLERLLSNSGTLAILSGVFIFIGKRIKDSLLRQQHERYVKADEKIDKLILDVSTIKDKVEQHNNFDGRIKSVEGKVDVIVQLFGGKAEGIK